MSAVDQRADPDASPFRVTRYADYSLPPRGVHASELEEHAASWWLLEQMEAWDEQVEEEVAVLDAAPAHVPWGVPCQVYDDRGEGFDCERAMKWATAVIERRQAVARLLSIEADPNLRSSRARALCQRRAFPGSDLPPHTPTVEQDRARIRAWRRLVEQLSAVEEPSAEIEDSLAYMRTILDVVRDEAEREAEASA